MQDVFVLLQIVPYSAWIKNLENKVHLSCNNFILDLKCCRTSEECKTQGESMGIQLAQSTTDYKSNQP